MAPRKSRFFVFKLCRTSRWGTWNYEPKSSTCTKGSRDRPTSARTYSDADPGLVCPAAAAAAAVMLLVAESVFGFPEKQSLFETSRTRLSCLVHSLSVSACVTASSCVVQHVSRPRLSAALNAHGTNANPGGLYARAHTIQTFSCYECGCKLSNTKRFLCFEFYLRNETQLYECSWADCACPQQRSGRIPKTCSR